MYESNHDLSPTEIFNAHNKEAAWNALNNMSDKDYIDSIQSIIDGHNGDVCFCDIVVMDCGEIVFDKNVFQDMIVHRIESWEIESVLECIDCIQDDYGKFSMPEDFDVDTSRQCFLDIINNS